MSQYSVIIQPEAEQDFDEAFAYFEAQQSGLGFTLLEKQKEIYFGQEVFYQTSSHLLEMLH